MTYVRIAGVGSFLPEKVLTNKDLEGMMETSDEWIRERTGIKRRHIAADDETTSTMATEAVNTVATSGARSWSTCCGER